MPVWKHECPVNPKHKTYGTNNVVKCVDCGQVYTIKSKDTEKDTDKFKDYEVDE